MSYHQSQYLNMPNLSWLTIVIPVAHYEFHEIWPVAEKEPGKCGHTIIRQPIKTGVHKRM